MEIFATTYKHLHRKTKPVKPQQNENNFIKLTLGLKAEKFRINFMKFQRIENLS